LTFKFETALTLTLLILNSNLPWPLTIEASGQVSMTGFYPGSGQDWVWQNLIISDGR